MNLFVKKKDTNKIYQVEAINNDKNGYPHFLIFDYNGNKEWAWVSAKNFVKVDFVNEVKKDAKYCFNQLEELYNGIKQATRNL